MHVFFSESWNFFISFFRIFNVDIFWALILQKCIGSRYLVPSTPPTVFGQSFWNFTEAFRMVWRCACGVSIILKVFLITFSAFLALLYVELISQGESPASVREYVSTWVRQYVHKHFIFSVLIFHITKNYKVGDINSLNLLVSLCYGVVFYKIIPADSPRMIGSRYSNAIWYSTQIHFLLETV